MQLSTLQRLSNLIARTNIRAVAERAASLEEACTYVLVFVPRYNSRG